VVSQAKKPSLAQDRPCTAITESSDAVDAFAPSATADDDDDNTNEAALRTADATAPIQVR
jgi:hypothetical protein